MMFLDSGVRAGQNRAAEDARGLHADIDDAVELRVAPEDVLVKLVVRREGGSAWLVLCVPIGVLLRAQGRGIGARACEAGKTTWSSRLQKQPEISSRGTTGASRHHGGLAERLAEMAGLQAVAPGQVGGLGDADARAGEDLGFFACETGARRAPRPGAGRCGRG